MSDNAPAASGQSTLSVRPVLFGLPLDGVLCFATRSLRMLAYGAVAPVLVLYVLSLGYTTTSVGVLLTCILLGDLAVTLVLSTRADAFGRRKTLVVGSGLKILAGVAFASSSDFRVLLLAGIVGVISTSGGECGPFLAIEQAALTDSVLASRGTTDTAGAGDVAVMFGYFNAIGCLFQAMGALLSGFTVQLLEQRGVSSVGAYRVVFMAYASTGLTMALLYGSMSKAVEVKGAPSVVKGALGLRRRESVHVVARLSAFFALDALGGAFTVQTYVAFFFSERWGFSPEKLGVLLMAANLVAGLSGIAASYFVKRFGAMLTMIVTHLPSNVLLLFVPLMPTANSTAAMLVARFCISQMDVPARQSYVVMVVAPDERSAAGGITNIVRSLGAAPAPLLWGYLSSARPRDGWEFASPWLISAGLKIIYDISLYAMYKLDGGMRNAERDAPIATQAEAAGAAAALREPLLGAENDAPAEASSA